MASIKNGSYDWNKVSIDDQLFPHANDWNNFNTQTWCTKSISFMDLNYSLSAEDDLLLFMNIEKSLNGGENKVTRPYAKFDIEYTYSYSYF